MSEVAMNQASWWKFPMKPVRTTESVFKTVDPAKYVMEKKYDGWRAIVTVGKAPTLWTRERKKIEMPKNLEEQLRALGLPEGTVLDGEIWNPEKRGSWRHNGQVVCQLTLWDAVRLGFKDLSAAPLEERQAVLDDLMREACPDVRAVRREPMDHALFCAIREEATKVRETTRSGFIHGVVLKRRGSPRRDHSTRCVEHADWLKVVFEGMAGWEMR